jgi:peroxiredoxin family protein
MNTPSNVAPMKDLDPQMNALVREEVERLLAARSGESAKEDLETRVTALERRAPQNKVSIVVFSDEMDKVLAAFAVASGALAMDMEVSMYFTFWGLSAIRQETHLDGKDFRQRMMGVFLPENSRQMGLSKMNMLGLGPRMMRTMMRQKNITSLEEMRALVTEMGTRMIACTMAMDLMGIKQTELIPGVQLGGVATFMDEALNSRLTLFL